jgi:dTDP-4-dehydrorhamnose reductase
LSAEKTKVLVLGATGMLGNAVMRLFAVSPGIEVTGSARSASSAHLMPPLVTDRLVYGVEMENSDCLIELFTSVKPHVVINCIGLVKQLADAGDPLLAIPINSLLPHRLAHLCKLADARFVHISTDCVFSGTRGLYSESDPSDANDLYGRSKYLGEVDYPNAITIRTSIIGHEIQGAQGLVEWFLAQNEAVNGYRKAIFSGLPTVELARVIRDLVIPNPKLCGVFHVSAEPISKFDLLTLIGQAYKKQFNIRPDDTVVIDRSLDSSRFREVTGFRPEPWPELVRRMHEFSKMN